jgi:hypothetical protein
VGAAPWADTAQRIRSDKQEQTQKATLEAKQILRRKVTDARFENVALGEVIDGIRDRSGLNIHVNWKALEAQGIGRETAVSVRLHDVPLRKLLRELLNQTSTDSAPAFYIDDGVLEITTREIADRELITKVYPVGDLLVEVPNFVGPNVQLSNAGQGGGGRSGGGGNSSLFSDNGSNESAISEQPKTKDQRAEELVSLIKETVKPELWRDNGGTATIRFFNNHIVVTAPRSVHEALGSD